MTPARPPTGGRQPFLRLALRPVLRPFSAGEHTRGARPCLPENQRRGRLPAVPNQSAVIAYDGSNATIARLAEIFAINVTAPEPSTLVDVTRSAQRQPNWDPVRLLVVGTPTVDRGASPAITAWLDEIAAPNRRLAVATFDLRHRGGWIRKGNAAGQVAKALRRAGFLPDMGSETFYLDDEPGHLEQGQLERAATWSYGLGLAAGTNLEPKN